MDQQQYYSLPNLEDVQPMYHVVVANDDTSLSNASGSQDDSALSDAHVVFQAAPNQSPFSQSTHYIMDGMSAQTPHQSSQQPQRQIIIQQASAHKQYAEQQDHMGGQQQQLQNIGQAAQQTGQHTTQQTTSQQTTQQQPSQHQQQQQQQTQQLYYTSESVLPQNSLVHHAHNQQQQQQQQQELVQQQQSATHLHVQASGTQHVMPQHYSMYRMQQQQSTQSPQGLSLLNNAHLILQQPSGQVLIHQTTPHSDLMMREQRIVYNSHRVMYQPASAQAQSILQQQQQQQQQQQAPSQQQQQQQTAMTTSQQVQLQTGTRIVSRLSQTTTSQAQELQQSPNTTTVYHQIQRTTKLVPQQSIQLQISPTAPHQQQQQQQQQSQPQSQPQTSQPQTQSQITQSTQQQLAQQQLTMISSTTHRTVVRNKFVRGSCLPSNTLITRLPHTAVRPMRGGMLQAPGSTTTMRASRPRNPNSPVSTRGRGGARCPRPSTVRPSSIPGAVTIMPQPPQQMLQTQSQQQLLVKAVGTSSSQTTSTSSHNSNNNMPIYRLETNVIIQQQTTQAQLPTNSSSQLAQSQSQLQPSSLPSPAPAHQQFQIVQTPATVRLQTTAVNASSAVRFKSPPLTITRQVPMLTTNSNSSNSSDSYTVDLEDSIQAAVVKKDPGNSSPLTIGSSSSNSGGGGTETASTTTVTNIGGRDEEDTRFVRAQNGASMTLSEYKKRNLNAASMQANSSATITTAAAAAAGGNGNTIKTGYGIRTSLPASSNSAAANTAAAGTRIMHNSPNASSVSNNTATPNSNNSSQSSQSNRPTPNKAFSVLQQAADSSSSSVHQTSHNNYEIQTQHVLQNRHNNCMDRERDRNSAKMLVILVSGEQRLITFTLPRESCTVQDLLEQVQVPFDHTTTIQCVENPGADIDFVVTVGFSVQESPSELISRAEQSIQMTRQEGSNSSSSSNANTNSASTDKSNIATSAAQLALAVKPPADDRKATNGFYAICVRCGFSGLDFSKCERCKRVFADPPKRVPFKQTNDATKPTAAAAFPDPQEAKKRAYAAAVAAEQRKMAAASTSAAQNALMRARGLTPTVRPRATRGGRKAEVETVVLTLSSDEDDSDDSPQSQSLNTTTVNNASTSSSSIALSFEMNMVEKSEKDEKLLYLNFERTDVTDLVNCDQPLSTNVCCKAISIGFYHFQTNKPIIFTSKGVCITAPLATDANKFFTLHIHRHEVVKTIAHFSLNNTESLICLYLLKECAKYVKSNLQMRDIDMPTDTAFMQGQYQMRKIILQFSTLSEKDRGIIRSIFNFIDEVSFSDARTLMQRVNDFNCNRQNPMDVSNKDEEHTQTTQIQPHETRQLLIYPPGKGGICINTEDYLCLATDQYLNDIIIDFYLKWVHNNIVPVELRARTHIFSTFFYKRLTTMSRHQPAPQDKDVKFTAAQKRHARVQNWTKHSNLFDKDFIIIPINEHSHWFLAIVCFPMLSGPVRSDNNEPVDPHQAKKQSRKRLSVQIGNTTITTVNKREAVNPLNDNATTTVMDEESERDEAEGDDSDLTSDCSDFDATQNNSDISTTAAETTDATKTAAAAAAARTGSNDETNKTQVDTSSLVSDSEANIKQPIILIFDSLTGTSRSRVVATLRDYLTCEYKLKKPLPSNEPKIFNKDNMPGHCVKVPQQNNFTDCGLYLLQYVEQFFKDPIKDYRLPIKLNTWFDTLTVTRKREDISNLLQKLMNQKNGPTHKVMLPQIPFPTINGQLLESTDSFAMDFEEDQSTKDFESAEENVQTTTGSGCGVNGGNGNQETDATTLKVPATQELPSLQGNKIVMKRRIPTTNNDSESKSKRPQLMGDAKGTLTPQPAARKQPAKSRKTE